MDIDPIWTTSRTARQIFALGQVEKVASRVWNLLFFFLKKASSQDITRLLSLAASSTSLLTLPQTDDPDEKLPQGDERSEQFVLEANEYFVRLDVSLFLSDPQLPSLITGPPKAIQAALRSSLAHIRHSRIAPSAINAPTPNFIPPSLGVGLSSETNGTLRINRGLQEERVERDAWKGVLESLKRVKGDLPKDVDMIT